MSELVKSDFKIVPRVAIPRRQYRGKYDDLIATVSKLAATETIELSKTDIKARYGASLRSFKTGVVASAKRIKMPVRCVVEGNTAWIFPK